MKEITTATRWPFCSSSAFFFRSNQLCDYFSKMDNKIKQNLVYLADNLTNLDRILLYLMQNDVISRNERDRIRKEDTPFNKNSELLVVIQRKNMPITIFLEILRKTQNGHCADEIEGISRETERQLETFKILKKIWWPDKKRLIKSLHPRKIGKKLLIEELHDRISKDENRMVVLCESADSSKLTGLGGVGKTLTATWYAHHYENEYDHVIWMDSGEGSLLTSFKKLARDLKIEDRNECIDLEDFSTKSYDTLEEFKCLWIFDNAENYRGDEGIKDFLPKFKSNFYCLITSRWREWGTQNIGYGQISRLELNIFGESESLEFFKNHLKQEIKYTVHQLQKLCRLLGNHPLALQLAVTALNIGNIDLQNYIEKTSTKDIENIVNTKFDAYEKTINASVQITLELIVKEECGHIAKQILNVFGYIRPDNVGKHFLTKIIGTTSELHKEFLEEFDKALKLLTKYSLITTQVTEVADRESKSKDNKLMTVLGVHRLLQQVIRHNGRKTEKDTLRKILGCDGFIEYKLIPFTKYADEELRKEFPKVKAELLDQQQLLRFVKEERFEESVELAKLIDKELQQQATKFNYAICLEMNGQLEDGIKLMGELYEQYIIDEKIFNSYNSTEMGLLKLEAEVSKSLVGGHLLVSLWKMDNKERIQDILTRRKKFKMIHSQEMMTTILRILNSNLIQSNYSLTNEGWMFTFALEGTTKKIELNDCSVTLFLTLPNDLEELYLKRLRFKDSTVKDTNNRMDVSNWLPKKLNTLEIICWKPEEIILSLRSISSIKNIILFDCLLSLDSVNRISPMKLKLESVSFVQNGQKLWNAKVNEFINFYNMNRLELDCVGKSNLSIDLSEEFANMEYLRLESVTVKSLKSANGSRRVKIKEANIRNCSLDLSVLPSSLEILSLFSLGTKVFVSGGIDLPNLKLLKLEGMSPLSHFRSLKLIHLDLKWVEELNMDFLPPSIKIIRMDRGNNRIRVSGGFIHLDKLLLHDFPLNEVEEMLPHFQIKHIVIYTPYSGYKPKDLIQLKDKKISVIVIGYIDWRGEDFKNSILSKHVDRKSDNYLFHKGKGKAIQKIDFDEQIYDFPYYL